MLSQAESRVLVFRLLVSPLWSRSPCGGARAVWLGVTAGVRGSATALMERLDALTDPERVEDANMLAGWGAGRGARDGARGREGRA